MPQDRTALLPVALPTDDLDDATVESFIATWEQAQASERSNGQPFIIALCRLLDVPVPKASQGNRAADAYIFERAVDFQDGATTSTGFIDLYKRGCFVLETKQGVDEDRKRRGKAKKAGHGTRGSNAWERTMKAAKEQAARYARNLDVPARDGRESVTEPLPPFVIACDAGYCFDLYANFGHPQRYSAFPDQRTYRIYLTDLRDPKARATLRLAFTDPEALDPSRRQAEVTRELAATLARLASELEADGHSPDAVFGFLTRCLFTMFAEDTDLLPQESFTGLLREYRPHLDVLPDALESLWATMDAGGFSPALKARVRRFNGKLFHERQALPLTEAHLDLLLQAATSDWRNVEPAIFGTLLERALDARERHKLGAHYTPRAYVERLVMPTVIDPLREEWDSVQVAVAQIEAEREEALTGSERGDETARRKARREILDLLNGFLGRLTSLRVLDPACGSGNFLYVTLEHLKRLEAEVRALLERYGGATLEMQSAAVTPEQLLGIEINPRAAAIADLVLWIGFLQWHLRTYGGPQALAEPILHAYGNIECRDAVLAYADKTPRMDEAGEPVTIWDGRTTKPSAATGEPVPDPEARISVYDYTDPRPAEWPAADFIVGNPPFVGNKRMRDALGDGYTEALRSAYKQVPDSADLVMYWWHSAAERVRASMAERFGLITTNSVTMTFNRRVVEQHLSADPPLALAFAVPDHPWVDDTFGADVRVAMTVGTPGPAEGALYVIEREAPGEEAQTRGIEFVELRGEIFADLSLGVDVTSVVPLQANEGLGFMGLIPLGVGFRLDEVEVERLGYDPMAPPRVIRRYKTGGDVARNRPDRLLIDFHGFSEHESRSSHPALFQHLHDHVKPLRDRQKRKSNRERWWLHGEARPGLREAVREIDRFIATVETSKHRYFVFLDGDILPDQKLRVVAHDDAYVLGVLSSVIHVVWSLGSGGRLGVGNDPVYNGTKTFDPFPFPAATDEQLKTIRDLGERLDAHRKRVLVAHDDLTPTGLYNVLDALREAEATGGTLSDKDRVVYERGQVGLLRDIHDRLDAAVAEAYGWGDFVAQGFPAQEVLRRVVALNAARQAEEASGLVRWLRPSFQAPDAVVQTDLGMTEVMDVTDAGPREPEPWPATLPERARAVRRVLTEAARPQTAEQVARAFRRAPRKDVTALLDTMVEFAQARVTEKGAYAV